MTTIKFCGYTWDVAGSGTRKLPPGPNYYSTQNVWVDTLNHLHLSICRQAEKWSCASVTLQSPIGYGLYEFFIISQFDLLEPNAIVGLFLYQDDNHELDIELSRWGNPDG